MLKRLSFDVEVLTPAFVGGHEPRKLDEYTPLRPHTVRGLLRWWFRAAAGALMWPADDSDSARRLVIAELRKAESALFGDTERVSNVVVLPPTVERSRCRLVARYVGTLINLVGREDKYVHPLLDVGQVWHTSFIGHVLHKVKGIAARGQVATKTAALSRRCLTRWSSTSAR